MGPLLRIAVTALAATLGARFVSREWVRINDELDRVRGKDRKRFPTLRRDKQSDEWRPSR